VGTTPSFINNVSYALKEDISRYSTSYWRMLLPNGDQNFEAFILSVASALQSRPLGRPCLEHALDKLTANLDMDSLWLEFGVWMGRSLNLIGRRSRALNRTRKPVGFDSFRGLPEVWRHPRGNWSGVLGDAWAKRWTAQGAFDLGGVKPDMFVEPGIVEFEVGWFNESLPNFLTQDKSFVSLVHIDSDLYSSALTVLTLVAPRLKPGSIIIFDELINYPGFRSGEMRALYDWLRSSSFQRSGLSGIQVIGYRGPNIEIDDKLLESAIREQRGEGRRYPQDALFRVW